MPEHIELLRQYIRSNAKNFQRKVQKGAIDGGLKIGTPLSYAMDSPIGAVAGAFIGSLAETLKLAQDDFLEFVHAAKDFQEAMGDSYEGIGQFVDILVNVDPEEVAEKIQERVELTREYLMDYVEEVNPGIYYSPEKDLMGEELVDYLESGYDPDDPVLKGSFDAVQESARQWIADQAADTVKELQREIVNIEN